MRPTLDRDPRVVCPTVPAPVGAGMLFAGGNGNIVRGNWFYDNWFAGAMLAWVPPIVRGEEDPAKLYEVLHDNHYVSNVWSRRPDGTRDRNGVDVWWDGEGTGKLLVGTGADHRGRADLPAGVPERRSIPAGGQCEVCASRRVQLVASDLEP